MLKSLVVIAGLIGCLCVGSAKATLINFDGVADATMVNETYTAQGAHFTNALILVAGISLNEIDFPPSSGTGVASDQGGPIEIAFDAPVDNLTANFTFLQQLTITMFDASHATLGTFFTPATSNTGGSDRFNFGFDGVSSLTIAGNSQGSSFVMDDLTFDVAATNPVVPEPASLALIGFGLASVAGLRRRKSQA